MRARFLTLVPALAFALALATPAHAAAPATLKVRSCQTGDTPSERSATFYGRMRRIPRTRRMMMRFTLIDRSSDDPSEVAAPRRLGRWHRSRPRVLSFGYAQKVTGLKAGGTYGVVVRYRWVDKRGRTIKRARQRSRDCRQDGELPNLAITGIRASRGEAPGTQLYTISVTNRGRRGAGGMTVHVIVDSVSADAAEIQSLGAGETATVEVSGPPCRGRVRAVVDRRNAIPETTEDDNSLRKRCRAVAG